MEPSQHPFASQWVCDDKSVMQLSPDAVVVTPTCLPLAVLVVIAVGQTCPALGALELTGWSQLHDTVLFILRAGDY